MSTPIHKFFTKEIVVKRLCTISGYKKAFQATATVEGAIQEMSKETRLKLELAERTWIGWFDIEEDIREGDTLVDENDVSYTVTEVTKKDYGVNQHLQVIMQEFNA